jgi:hypothetical protein
MIVRCNGVLGRALGVVTEEDAKGFLVNVHDGIDDLRNQHSENSKHGYKQNGRIPISLGKFSGDHPASKAVISTDMKTGEEVYYEAAMDAIREGFDSSSISRCCNGESSYHKGRFWRFANEKMKARWGDRAA